MAVSKTLKLFAGDDKIVRLTFTRESDGTRLNLDTDVTEIEFQVKPAEGGADPALITLNMVAAPIGIVKLAQVGDTLGQADLTIPSSETSPPFVPGIYRHDVVVILTAGGRNHVVSPSDFIVEMVVNQA